jgi:hypothetical protein
MQPAPRKFFSWNASRQLAKRDKTKVGSGSIWQQSVMLESGSQTERCVLIVRSQMIRQLLSLICVNQWQKPKNSQRHTFLIKFCVPDVCLRGTVHSWTSLG